MEDGKSKKNINSKNVAMIGVRSMITHPPNAKRTRQKRESGNSIDTVKLNQKSAFISYLPTDTGRLRGLYRLRDWLGR